MRADQGRTRVFDFADHPPVTWRRPTTTVIDTRHDPVVYYMRMDRLVKIGWTGNLKRRTAAIGPHGVMAVEPGAANIEELRHIEFDRYRSHLEWFWLAPALAEHIVAVRARFEEQQGQTTEQWLVAHGVYSAAIINPGPAYDA